jgi:hypothetical protein
MPWNMTAFNYLQMNLGGVLLFPEEHSGVFAST